MVSGKATSALLSWLSGCALTTYTKLPFSAPKARPVFIPRGKTGKGICSEVLGAARVSRSCYLCCCYCCCCCCCYCYAVSPPLFYFLLPSPPPFPPFLRLRSLISPSSLPISYRPPYFPLSAPLYYSRSGCPRLPFRP